MKFLYATAGELNHYAKNTETFERNNARAFMELGKHRVLTVFGVGKIGKRIYDLAGLNGLTVQGVDIRQEYLNDLYQGAVHFVSREEAISSSDIIVNAMNLTRNEKSAMYQCRLFFKGISFTGKRRTDLHQCDTGRDRAGIRLAGTVHVRKNQRHRT